MTFSKLPQELVRWRGFKPVEGFEYFAENRAEAIEMVLRRRTE